jgi:hypothetical protein
VIWISGWIEKRSVTATCVAEGIGDWIVMRMPERTIVLGSRSAGNENENEQEAVVGMDEEGVSAHRCSDASAHGGETVLRGRVPAFVVSRRFRSAPLEL